MTTIRRTCKTFSDSLVGNQITNGSVIFTNGNFIVETNLNNNITGNTPTLENTNSSGYTLNDINNIVDYTDNTFNKSVSLNVNPQNLLSFAYYGSLEEYIKGLINEIILEYPASLRIEKNNELINTVLNYQYSINTDTSFLKIPIKATKNYFDLKISKDANGVVNNLKDLNLSFNKYALYDRDNLENTEFEILGFTGNTTNDNYLYFSVKGNPFPFVTNYPSNLNIEFHIKPKNEIFKTFKNNLDPLIKYVFNTYDKTKNAYVFKFSIPTVDSNGNIFYYDKEYEWKTSDGYNIDIKNSFFSTLYEELLELGKIYDGQQSDLVINRYVPSSILEWDLTSDQKMQKLLRIYGRSFDEIKKYIDGVKTSFNLSYDRFESSPNELIKIISENNGWDPILLVDGDSNFQNYENFPYFRHVDEVEKELWNIININSNRVFNSKGKRFIIEDFFNLLGVIPGLIELEEYVYTVISGGTTEFPVISADTPNFYFQMSGDTDAGQGYLNKFREQGFSLQKIKDNKKSWVSNTTNYEDEFFATDYTVSDIRKIINSKEIKIKINKHKILKKYMELNDGCVNNYFFDILENHIDKIINVYIPFVRKRLIPATSIFTGIEYDEEEIIVKCLNVSNDGPVCAGGTLTLTTTYNSPTAIYQWSGPNNYSATGRTVYINNITQQYAGVYQLLVNDNGVSFNDNTIVVVNRSPIVSVEGETTVASGGTLSLTAISDLTGTTFYWTGPNMYTATGETITRSNFSSVMAGDYSVIGVNNICSSISVSTKVTLSGSTSQLEPFDYAIVRYKWNSNGGQDLDTRTYITNVDPSVNNKYVGWSRGYSVGTSKKYLEWGGDNTMSGVESVLINFKALTEDFPNVENINIGLNAFWFSSRNSGDIVIEFATYLGGTMVKSGYDFINNNGTQVDLINIDRNVLTQINSNVLGDHIGTLIYNTLTKIGNIE